MYHILIRITVTFILAHR